MSPSPFLFLDALLSSSSSTRFIEAERDIREGKKNLDIFPFCFPFFFFLIFSGKKGLYNINVIGSELGFRLWIFGTRGSWGIGFLSGIMEMVIRNANWSEF